MPLMKSLEEAEALCQQKRDGFYLDAFYIETWLGAVFSAAQEEYAGKKEAKQRQMQTGQAWRSFMHYFDPACEKKCETTGRFGT